MLHKHACACTKHTVLFLHLCTYCITTDKYTQYDCLSFLKQRRRRKKFGGLSGMRHRGRSIHHYKAFDERQQQNNTRGNQTQVTLNSPLEVLLWRRKWNQWNQHHHLCSQRSQHKSIMFTGLISVAWWCLITSNTVLGWQYEHHNKVYNHQRTNSLYRLEVHGISQIPSIQCPIEGLLQQISWHSLEVD